MFLDGKVLKRLRAMYPKGAKVRLLFMDDKHAPPVGTLGTVWGVDDVGTVHVEWETGSSLGAAYGVDKIELVKEEV